MQGPCSTPCVKSCAFSPARIPRRWKRRCYERNIRTLQALGLQGWAALQAQCRMDAEDAKHRDSTKLT